MYRIRSASGTELVFNSLEEFTVAVRRGEVLPEDEIFHTRANRWLDVKSHPHYRTAISAPGHEHRPGTPVAAAPAAPSAPARPVSSPVSSPANPKVQNRAQVFERPVVKPAAQTVARPQLQAAPKPDAPAAPPAAPAKSKELTFVDVGAAPGTLPPNAVAPPKPQAPPKPEQKPAAAREKAPETELEFLVMDGGIESPVRTSAGYKTVPEDLNLLFDAPLPDQAGATKAPAAGVVAAAPQARPAAPAQSPSGKVPAVASAATAASGQTAEPVSREDLEIPGAPLLQSAPEPVHAIEPDQAGGAGLAPATAHKPRGMIIASGVAVLAIAAVVLAWRPWKSAPATESVAAQTAPAGTEAPPPAASTTAATAAPAPAEPAAPASNAPSTLPPAARPAPPTPARPDSETETVIAASKPNFKPVLAMPAAAITVDAGTGDGGSAAVAPSELARRLQAAEKQAQQELTSKLSSGGFRAVLAPGRLGTRDGVAGARGSWTAGSDAIRQYRARIARLEKAYEDSVLTSQRAQRWSGEEMRAWAGRQSLAEPAETAQLVDLMFSQVGEGLEILSALDGQYTMKGDAIGFKNAASATRYTSIRTWVEQRMSSWAATPEGARPVSVNAILRALGDGFPAVQ